MSIITLYYSESTKWHNSILVTWVGCRFWMQQLTILHLAASKCCVREQDTIHISSFDSADKRVPDWKTVVVCSVL